MAALLAMLRVRVRVLAPCRDSGEIAHRSGTINGVPRPRRIEICAKTSSYMYLYGLKKDSSSVLRLSKMHRNHENYPEQRLLFLVCVCAHVHQQLC